jgi:acetyl esterase/lipase
MCPAIFRRWLFFGCLLLCVWGGSGRAVGQSYTEIPVWPGGAAEGKGGTEAERTDSVSGRIYNVSEASMRVYPASAGVNRGIAVVICPGGGYAYLSGLYEGSLFAEWYAANGITAAVLKYRLPNGHPLIPLKDVQEAIRILRREAGRWNIDPHKTGVSGFSAGGHLAATALTAFDASCRPDFGILFYPAISVRPDFARGEGFRRNLLGESPDSTLIARYSCEDHVSRDTPPTLLMMCDDDRSVAPRNATLFYDRLKEKGVPASLHIFPSGGHGWGFRSTFPYHEAMKSIVLDWLGKVDGRGVKIRE